MIDLLLERNDVDLNLRTTDDKCALQFALMPPQTTGPPFDLAKRLIEKGAKPDEINDLTSDSLLQSFIKANLEDPAIFLCDHDNLNHINNNGLTALHLAAQKGQDRLVQALLSKGASANTQSGIAELKTALHYAVEANSLAVVQIFVDHQSDEAEGHERPDFNLKNSCGDSPLSLALAMGFNDLVPLLIKGGSDINARNGDDITLLHQAIIKEDGDLALFLLAQGADMNALTSDQESPLQLAIHCRLAKVVDELCTLGVALSAPNNKGDCPLWSALETDQEDICKVRKFLDFSKILGNISKF